MGEAAVRQLAAKGANVAIFDRDTKRGESVAAELGKNVAFFEMDATKEDSIKKAIEATVSKFGASSLYGAVNSAGIGAATLTVDKKNAPHPSEGFDFVMKVNLYGTFNTCKHVAAIMSKNQPDANGLRGVLINVASVAAIEGQKGQVAYAGMEERKTKKSN